MKTFSITIQVTMSDEALDGISELLIEDKRLGTTWEERYQSISETAAKNLANEFADSALQYTNLGPVWVNTLEIAHEATNETNKETTF